tara:strand:- start:1130 stop:1294 length:165 start_codon:yes stop_codon:yes gene_type:complete
MEETKWGQEIADLINKKSAEIEDPLKRWKYFGLLAHAARHESLHAAKLMENDNE